MKGALLALALLLGTARAQDVLTTPVAPRSLVSFEFERPGLAVPHWGISVNLDGSGTYWEPVPVSDRNPDGRVLQPLHISAQTLQRLQAGNDRAATHSCETKAKNIANTGRKTLAGTAGSCIFNYSDDKGVMDSADTFQAIAETMQAGARLGRKRRFDRLGLDAEIRSLDESVKAGRAIELANIAPVLRSIANDSEVLERVRTKAARWLKEIQ